MDDLATSYGETTHDIDDQRLASHVAKLISACEDHADEQKSSRERSLQYYDGVMTDLPAAENRSSVVSKDVRTVIKKLMPSIMRTFFGKEKIVNYHPAGPDDEAFAAQATDYVNHHVMPKCGVEEAVHDAIFDSFTVKTGVLKHVAYNKASTKVYSYTDQPSSSLVGLEGEEGIEIFDVVARPETSPEILEMDPQAERIDFKMRRMEQDIDIRSEAVPRGSFLIYPGAVSIEDSPIVGERQVLTRSELVSRGFDRDTVFALSCYDTSDNDDHRDELSRLGEDYNDTQENTSKALERVLVHEVYVKLDQDDDGIAELYKMCMAERSNDDTAVHTILSMEPVSEVPYSEVVCEREAHQFEGHSIAEDVMDIQRIKTALVRETLDNIYWQNKAQPAVDVSKLTEQGLEAVYAPGFGKPITLKPNTDVRQAVQWNQVPFVGQHSFSMMEYFDDAVRDRTGITDQSSGLDPSAFQDVTATSANLLSENGIAQAEMIVKVIARCLRKHFKGLLRLVIAHADKARTVRLRGEWVEYDPRHWDVDMDCSVNVGLGAGSRERDLQMLQVFLGLQKEFVASAGPDNPFVKPEQIYNTVSKIVETSGAPSADPYFTKPDPQEIEAKLKQAAEQPSEAQIKAEAEQGLMQMKLQVTREVEEMKTQSRVAVEHAQMEADLRVRQAELDRDTQLQAQKAELERQKTELRIELDFIKHRERMQLEQQKLGLPIGPPQPVQPMNANGVYNAE